MKTANKKIDRTEMLIFTSWALFFVFVLVSGRLPLYITPRFAMLPLLGAVIFGAMAFIYRHGRPRSSHTHRDWSLIPWFLMPVVLSLIVAPVDLGAFVAGNRQASLMGQAHGNSGISLDLSRKSGYKEVTIVDLAQAGKIKGGKVSVEGQLVGGSSELKVNESLIAHYKMVCCVADVSPVAIILELPSGYTPQKDQWVRVNGTARREARGVVLKADMIQPIAAPNPPYLY